MAPDPRWRIHLTTIDRERMGPELTERMLTHLRRLELEGDRLRARVAELEPLSWQAELLDTIKYAVPHLGDLAEMAGYEVKRDGEHVSIGPKKTQEPA